MNRASIHSDSYKSFVDLLRSVRKNCGFTQLQLAEAIGEDQTFISKVETRERRLDIVELRRICDALGYPLGDLVSHWIGITDCGSTAGNDTPIVISEIDSEWSEDDWHRLLENFISTKVLSYKEIASLTLGHLNPSQVGTSIASKKTFQEHFPSRKCWQAVRAWHFEQTGTCIDCGTRLELQADHIETRQDHGDAADRLENMTLRCRRCNVIRRPSHKKGGLTFLTAEAALMWILFTKQPVTYEKYEELCREYGLTMANIRFQEAWAMARWLEREGLYVIDPNSKF